MMIQEDRLRQIRARLEADYHDIHATQEAANRPLPSRSPELECRIDRALNMQPETEIIHDSQGYIQELNKMLFRMKYRKLYAALSIMFIQIAERFGRLRDWAYNKAQRWENVI